MTTKPFLKWAGGKSGLKKEIESLIPDFDGVYYEPFLGGGAVFFHLKPKKAVLSDVNSQLINTYKVVKNDPFGLIRKLRGLKISKDDFYRIRALDRSVSFLAASNLDQAARLVYLNKTCFNGLYRVNSKGHFNTPYGDYKNPNLFDKDVFLSCSEALQSAEIKCCNYQDLEKTIKPADFIYLDPPYLPISETSNFTSYSAGNFGKEDHVELAEFCKRLNKKKVRFLMSNSGAEFIRDLYSDFNIKEVKARRSINSDSTKRNKICEFLIYNYLP